MDSYTVNYLVIGMLLTAVIFYIDSKRERDLTHFNTNTAIGFYFVSMIIFWPLTICWLALWVVGKVLRKILNDP